MSDYRNDDENKELTGQTMSDNHKTEDMRMNTRNTVICAGDRRAWPVR